MKTSLEIINKLSEKEAVKLRRQETKLASHEVELALVDDLISFSAKADTEIKTAFALRSKGKDLIRESINREKAAIAIYNEGLQLGKSILIKMKELGIQDPIVNEKMKSFNTNIAGGKDRLKFIEKAIVTFN